MKKKEKILISGCSQGLGYDLYNFLKLNFNVFGLKHYTKDWSNYDYLSKKEIIVTHYNKLKKGFYKGIDSNGNLLIKINSTNYITTVYSGDAFIIKSI